MTQDELDDVLEALDHIDAGDFKDIIDEANKVKGDVGKKAKFIELVGLNLQGDVELDDDWDEDDDDDFDDDDDEDDWPDLDSEDDED